MALIAVCSRERGLRARIQRALRDRHAVAGLPSWSAAIRVVRERPVAVLLTDVHALPAASCTSVLRSLRHDFPGVGVVALARGVEDPVRLFHLGRAGLPHLVLLSVDRLERELPRAVARARAHDTRSAVVSAVSPHVGRRETVALSIALEEVHLRLTAAELAARVGLSRPFLSECLKESSLPSTGHLLVWSRLLHAGAWLAEPGRTGESVARQLEYNDGSAFRRALRNYTGATPTRVVEEGGLRFVLSRFMERCGFSEPGTRSRVSVA